MVCLGDSESWKLRRLLNKPQNKTNCKFSGLKENVLRFKWILTEVTVPLAFPLAITQIAIVFADNLKQCKSS